MSIAKGVGEHLEQTGLLVFPHGKKAVVSNYGQHADGKVAFVFEDGSELSCVIKDKEFKIGAWSQAGESNYDLS